jgi:hypothetical protein
MTEFQNLFELDHLARKNAEKYPQQRQIYGQILAESGKHAIGIEPSYLWPGIELPNFRGPVALPEVMHLKNCRLAA